MNLFRKFRIGKNVKRNSTLIDDKKKIFLLNYSIERLYVSINAIVWGLDWCLLRSFYVIECKRGTKKAPENHTHLYNFPCCHSLTEYAHKWLLLHVMRVACKMLLPYCGFSADFVSWHVNMKMCSDAKACAGIFHSVWARAP